MTDLKDILPAKVEKPTIAADINIGPVTAHANGTVGALISEVKEKMPQNCAPTFILFVGVNDYDTPVGASEEQKKAKVQMLGRQIAELCKIAKQRGAKNILVVDTPDYSGTITFKGMTQEFQPIITAMNKWLRTELQNKVKGAKVEVLGLNEYMKGKLDPAYLHPTDVPHGNYLQVLGFLRNALRERHVSGEADLIGHSWVYGVAQTALSHAKKPQVELAQFTAGKKEPQKLGT